jgi:hypothetical protein
VSYLHKQLAEGRWAGMAFMEQMANIGSEAERALNWRAKKNDVLSAGALERALELLWLTIENNDTASRYKELTRLRETLLDFFMCGNKFNTTEDFLRKYFLQFARAARKNR